MGQNSAFARQEQLLLMQGASMQPTRKVTHHLLFKVIVDRIEQINLQCRQSI